MVLELVGHTSDVAEQPQLRAALDEAGEAAGVLMALDDAALTSWAGVARILEAGTRTMDALRAVETAVQDPALAARLENLSQELSEQLLSLYLRRHRPGVLRVASLLTIVDPLEEAEPIRSVVTDGALTRRAWVRDEFHFDRIGELLERPWPALRESYFPSGLATASDAHASAARLFPVLGGVAQVLGLSWSSEFAPIEPPPPSGATGGEQLHHLSGDPTPPPEQWTPAPPVDLTEFHRQFRPQLLVTVPELDATGAVAGARMGFLVVASGAEHPGGVAGLIVELAGTLAWAETRGSYRIAVSSDGEIPVFVVGPGGLELAPVTPPPLGGTVRLAVERVAAGEGAPAFVFGSETGTRVEVGALRADGLLALGPTERSAALTITASSGKLAIAPEDGDGFLRRVLPARGFGVDFELGLVISSGRGVELKGGAGLEAVLPAHVSLGSYVRVDAIVLGLAAVDGAVRARAGCALTLRLGPIAVSVDRIGVEATAAFPDAGGNLGPVDLGVDFLPPAGIGLALDAGPVSGGGFLSFDAEHARYAGTVQLRFEGIAAAATGLLTTKLPDRPDGFSLLVLISTEFPPVQLGLGFRLEGVGGLLAINRTVAVEALRAGLKTGSLGAVLSPPDPVGNASQVVATLAGVFPPAPGRHVFGPTARITWGAPTLITIDLCLALELPSPVRLIALGRLRAVLPDDREPVAVLQMDLLGVIDFDQREAAVDATLVDSRLASFALTGDMALRMGWGAEPSFLLAVGGFHPRFAAPPGFPALERVAVALATGKNPRLRLEAYLALTSNTVQLGARVDLSARAGRFEVAGFLSFDALVQLRPLAFEVAIAARLAVLAGGRTILSVSLELTLSGPAPWRARGRASFSILFFDVSFSFDVTIGPEATPALPAAVDVGALLHAALSDPRAWSAALPAGGDALVTLRSPPQQQGLLSHPLGALEVRQRVAPLKRTLERFGTDVPSGPRRFEIMGATIGGDGVTTAPLEDLFAPGQFLVLTDEQRLSSPSFAAMTSGARLGDHDLAHGTPVTAELTFEQRVVPATGVPAQPAVRTGIPGDVLLSLIGDGPAPAPRPFAIRHR